MEFRLGGCQTLNDPKTNQYLKNYQSVNMAITLYLKRLSLAYTFNPATLETINKDIPLNNGVQLTIGNGVKFIDILKHDFSFGYDVFLNNKWCLTPKIGFFFGYFQVYEDGSPGTFSGATDPKYHFGTLYGYNGGFGITRYFSSKESASGFIRLNSDFSEYNLNTTITSLGNYFYTVSLSLGVRFGASHEGWRNFTHAFVKGTVRGAGKK